MTNKYLEKIASDHMREGYLSPAWQENAIAKDHGKKGLEGVGPNVKKHLIGVSRAVGRGYLEAAGAGAAGAGVGALAGKAFGKTLVGALAGAAVGAYGGLSHGAYKSIKNQAAEAHKKYSE